MLIELLQVKVLGLEIHRENSLGRASQNSNFGDNIKGSLHLESR